MAEAGVRGPQVRSDCWVNLEPGGSDIRIELKSTVLSMYGEAIHSQTRLVMETLGVTDALVQIEDGGALPFVLAARLETAARRAGLPIEAPALPEPLAGRFVQSPKNRLRRSRLYLPGNQPNFMINAGLHGPDAVILDLEDSVAPGEKDAARALVRNALVAVDFCGAEKMVRINQLPAGIRDLSWVVPYGAQLILIPKCEDPEQVKAVHQAIVTLDPPGRVWLMPIVESALGCLRAYEIATASPAVVALTIGLEDYTADIGAQRTQEGRESFWARSVIVNAARAAGVQAIDTVFSDVEDMEGLRASVVEAKGLGFEGKGCIHPRQIRVVHEAFAPAPQELEKAMRIVRAFEEAEQRGLAVVSLGSKMIDPPVVKRALATVDLAVTMGRLQPDWREREALA
ncbi:MAG: HpcH/HpaI aldolase/citrate lyase family protein [Bradymonadales bacterium]|nr:HpcH/HpaI aldolase/citrate lyase family protein [Bradymonadales bacterium]